ncbi:uncharacterized protein LOC126673714 [Mercurialis annua]|uniref:uncharacterized protein LOC126673714 n=1 Tax=Mercurialis annua TaxID=3986 RepID=UPI0024ACB00D|nr:uncharacterized protein LOC126673714 [Mercurialis annua]
MTVGVDSVLRAEFKRAYQGLLLAWNMGYRRVTLEVDNKTVVDKINSSEIAAQYTNLLFAIRSLIRREWDVQVPCLERQTLLQTTLLPLSSGRKKQQTEAEFQFLNREKMDPDQDPDITSWIIEFCARQKMSRRLLNKIVKNLRVPISKCSYRSRETLFLRFIEDEIADGSVSEEILDLLHMIEELHNEKSVQIRDSMKSAYRAIAAVCTVKWLGGNSNEAVKKMWKERVDKLGQLKSELLTGELIQEIESVYDSNALSGETESLRLVEAYLTDAFGLLGTPFLELASMQIANADVCLRSALGLPFLETTDLSATEEPAETMESEITSPEVTRLRVRKALNFSCQELKLLFGDPCFEALNKKTSINTLSTTGTQDFDSFECDNSVDDPTTQVHFDSLSIDEAPVSSCSNSRPTELLKKRRPVKRWTLEEEDALRGGVEEFGKGNWKLILRFKQDIFGNRTEVDLKDKWRNMTR